MQGKQRVCVIALALLLLGAGLAPAQETGRIEGKVSRTDGTAIGGVSVRIDELDRSVLTESDGSFVLTDVPPGTYGLSFTLVDRTAQEAGVQVAAGGTAQVDKQVDWDVSFA
ncbi:MAG TPA: carboxypeptidase-like regulatory domain-containing protein, partial [Thermoanaerobaculia bacterium]|nr:carboxypeptidase-like regulatory domain-containing protein [Thermoanaerobaculia bacterium]